MSRGDQMLKDYYSENTRRHRRNLVAASIISILVAATGWFPSQISTLGLTFDNSDHQLFLWLLVGSVLYFLVSFLAYIWPESLYKNMKIYASWGCEEGEPGYPWQMASVSYGIRFIVDLMLPILLGSTALICLFWVGLNDADTNGVATFVLWTARVIATLLLIMVGIMLLMVSFEVLGAFKAAIRCPREGGAKHEDK